MNIWTQFNSVLLSLFLGSVVVLSSASARIIDQVVAVVNEDVITLSDLQPMLAPLQAKLQSISDPLKQQEILKEQVNQSLEMLIDNLLILQKARGTGLSATPEEIEQYTGYIRQQQGISEDEFTQRLQTEGMSMKAFQEQIKERIISQKVIA
jgi:peptidyl-prolyl cis-trans isomerase SurA